jgi:GntR family transcriptional repressor for pyruvate dehydrogenase complex
MPFQPIDSKRLYERVADQIGDMIRRGEFKAGQRLPAERDLAKSVGVSRPVVREALVALEIASLVEVRRGSGAYVREPHNGKRMLNAGHSPTDVLNARRIVEGEAAALAAANASERDIEAAADAVRRMIDEHDAGRPWSAADLAFHVAVAYASGNAALAMIVERLWQEQYGRVLSILSERAHLVENWPATLHGHQAILRAIRQRDAAAAREGMRAHLRQVLDVMTEDGSERACWAGHAMRKHRLRVREAADR